MTNPEKSAFNNKQLLIFVLRPIVAINAHQVLVCSLFSQK